jgi:hypothetical protein
MRGIFYKQVFRSKDMNQKAVGINFISHFIGLLNGEMSILSWQTLSVV